MLMHTSQSVHLTYDLLQLLSVIVSVHAPQGYGAFSV